MGKNLKMKDRLREILNFNTENLHLDKRPSVFVDALKGTNKKEAYLKYFEGLVKDLKNCEEVVPCHLTLDYIEYYNKW